MWEPVGPLPATVYWRRRGWAVVSTVAATLLVIWAVTALATPSPTGADGATSAAASRAAATATAPSPTPTSFRLPVLPGSTAPSATPPTAAPGPTTSGGPASSEQLRPDDSPRSSGPVPTPVAVPPTGPVACTDAMIAVAAEIDQAVHRVGQRPVLRLVVTNVSSQPCVRDLDSARQEIVVWSIDGATRLWSSNDCINGSSVDLRTLVPGQPVAFAVTWAGRTSTPGCTGARTVVPAGAYRVMTRVDDAISTPTPFERTA